MVTIELAKVATGFATWDQPSQRAVSHTFFPQWGMNLRCLKSTLLSGFSHKFLTHANTRIEVSEFTRSEAKAK